MSELKLRVILELFDPVGGENWLRSKLYDVPRGLHLSRTMEEVDSAIEDCVRIVHRKQQSKIREIMRKAEEGKRGEATAEEQSSSSPSPETGVAPAGD